MFLSFFIDLQNSILLVPTLPFFRKIILITNSLLCIMYIKKNNYFLLYELLKKQDLSYCISVSED